MPDQMHFFHFSRKMNKKARLEYSVYNVGSELSQSIAVYYILYLSRDSCPKAF